MERIVVGVDGSDAAGKALQWAVAEARRREAPLEVVYAWHQAFVAPYHIVGDIDAFAGKAKELLDTMIDTVDTTGVVVEPKLVTGGAAQALVREGKGASLLVVGSRGQGGFKGLLLGSVSQQVAQHAPCPLVIVPPAA